MNPTIPVELYQPPAPEVMDLIQELSARLNELNFTFSIVMVGFGIVMILIAWKYGQLARRLEELEQGEEK